MEGRGIVKILSVILFLMFSVNVWADGFLCRSSDEKIGIDVYNHTSPELGTRRAAAMILYNPSAPRGRGTIAIFRDESGALQNEGTTYFAYAHLKDEEEGRPEAFVVDGTLEKVFSLTLKIDFNYGRPVPSGSLVEGELTLVQRSGEQMDFALVCQRYLKGDLRN